MQPIDLRLFADHSVKIPAFMLNKTESSRPIPTWKILSAHMLDLWMATSMTMIACGQLYKFRDEVFSNALLQKAVTTSATMPLAVFIVILWSNFFFSYFLNHGQTAGLFAIKKRIQMKEQSFSDALKWSFLSTLTCLTGGISNLYIRVNESYASHDHLYHELIRVKEITSIDLLDQTPSQEEVEEFYQRAA